MSELVVSYDEHLVMWHGCWIRPSLLERITAAGRALPVQDADDVLGALVDALAGLDVLTMDQIPVRLLRALGLSTG